MSYPVPPNLDYSYTGFQQAQGDDAFPGTELDNDLANIFVSLNQAIDLLIKLTRSDGQLRNASVFPETLNQSVFANMRSFGAWSAGKAFTMDAVVPDSNRLYRALVDHTSSESFGSDLAAGKWLLMADFATLGLLPGSLDGQLLQFETVQTDKIAPRSITTEKLADNAVSTAKLAAAAVTLIKMAPNSVGSGQLLDGSVTDTKIPNGSITPEKFSETSLALFGLTRPTDSDVPSLTLSDGMSLPLSSNVFSLTGSGNIGTLVGQYVGRQVTLIFEGSPTLFSGGSFLLAGGTSWVVPAGSTLTLIGVGNDGTYDKWAEVSRSVGSGSTGPAIAAPVVSSPRTATAVIGTPFQYKITATNAPTTYGATGLPAWATLNSSTGIISGTPTSSGDITFGVTATNTVGTSAPQNVSLSITATPKSTLTLSDGLTLPPGSAFSLTGSPPVGSLYGGSSGRQVTLTFLNSPTIYSGGSFMLSGGQTWFVTPGSTLTLLFIGNDGTYDKWQEVSRTTAPVTVPTLTFTDGMTLPSEGHAFILAGSPDAGTLFGGTFPGRQVKLTFTGSPRIFPGGSFLLSGGATWTVPPGSTLTLSFIGNNGVYDRWQEISRT